MESKLIEKMLEAARQQTAIIEIYTTSGARYISQQSIKIVRRRQMEKSGDGLYGEAMEK